MQNQNEHFHGSDVEKIALKFNIPQNEIISFSANINPLGISPALRTFLADHIDVISAYPEREYTSLREAIGRYVNTGCDNITFGSGTSELISAFIKVLGSRHALIIGPTYSEYEHEVMLNGGAAHYFPLSEADDFRLNLTSLSEALQGETDLLVICNPNNPTSTLIPVDHLEIILKTCQDNNVMVLIDETYIEFVPEHRKSSAVQLTTDYPNLVVLRGISKFFAAPGLRLGYAVTASRTLLKAVNALKSPWSINSFAALAPEIMFTDHAYIEQTGALILNERTRIYNLLKAKNTVKVYQPQANFLLVRILRPDISAQDVFIHAIKHRMMIRDCSSFPFLDNQYFRFCVLTPAQNNQLLQCIDKIL